MSKVYFHTIIALLLLGISPEVSAGDSPGNYLNVIKCLSKCFTKYNSDIMSAMSGFSASNINCGPSKFENMKPGMEWAYMKAKDCSDFPCVAQAIMPVVYGEMSSFGKDCGFGDVFQNVFACVSGANNGCDDDDDDDDDDE